MDCVRSISFSSGIGYLFELAKRQHCAQTASIPFLSFSCGRVLHGNIGSAKRMEWGLIGDEASALRAIVRFVRFAFI